MKLSSAVLGAVLVSVGALSSARVCAKPGMHVPAISTFDTRSSSVVLAYRNDLSGVTARAVSYNANFTSTSGNFSAQFGAHYLQLRDIPEAPLAHGAGASGVGLFSLPLTRRHSNGVPVLAFDLYIGIAPTAAVSGPRNFLTAPLPMGVGLSYSPASWLTLTPWFEAAPSANLDTYISTEGIVLRQTQEIDIEDLDDPLAAAGLEESISDAIDQAIDPRFSLNIGLRAGVSALVHMGNIFDLRLGADYSTLGDAFGGEATLSAVAALGFHWDDVVPAILPAHRRLSRESCAAVERRFRMCPQATKRLTQGLPIAVPPAVSPAAAPAPTAPAVQPPVVSPPPTQQVAPLPSPSAPGSGVFPPAAAAPAPKPGVVPPPPPAAAPGPPTN